MYFKSFIVFSFHPFCFLSSRRKRAFLRVNLNVHNGIGSPTNPHVGSVGSAVPAVPSCGIKGAIDDDVFKFSSVSYVGQTYYLTYILMKLP